MADGATRVRVRGGVAEAIGLADARPRLAIGDWRLAIGDWPAVLVLAASPFALRPSPFALRPFRPPYIAHPAHRAFPPERRPRTRVTLRPIVLGGVLGVPCTRNPLHAGPNPPPEGANGRVSAGHVVSKAGSYAAGNRESGQIRKEAALSEYPGAVGQPGWSRRSGTRRLWALDGGVHDQPLPVARCGGEAESGSRRLAESASAAGGAESLGRRLVWLAEREGFEPSKGLNTPYSLSRRAPSTTRPPLPVPACARALTGRRILTPNRRQGRSDSPARRRLLSAVSR